MSPASPRPQQQGLWVPVRQSCDCLMGSSDLQGLGKGVAGFLSDAERLHSTSTLANPLMCVLTAQAVPVKNYTNDSFHVVAGFYFSILRATKDK